MLQQIVDRMDQLEAQVTPMTKSQQGMGKMKGEKAITSSPCYVDPLSATDARRDILPEAVWLPDPSKGRAAQEMEEPLCSWSDTRGLDKGYGS